jgi:ABC-type bacteriocin/lantibiotic exporter with double-glycine peptidase domain
MMATSPGSSVRDLPTLRESLRRYIRAAGLLRPYWGSYGKLAVLGLFVAAIGLVGPYFSKLLVDGVYPSRDVSLLTVVVGAMLAHALFSQLMNITQGYYGQVVAAHLTADTTVFMVNHVQHLPLRFFRGMPVGDILSRFGDLGSSLRSVRALFDLVFVRSLFLFLIPPILIAMNWRLALVAFATLPVTWGINVATARTLRRRWKTVAEARADLRALNVETLSHMTLLKSMGLEGKSFRRTAESAGVARTEAVAAARLSTMLGAMNGLARMVGTLLLTYIGWRMILAGTFTLGSFLAFTAYLGRIQAPLSRMSTLFSDFQRTAITLDRVFELLDEETETDPTLLYDPEYRPESLRFDGGIRLEGLRFEYPDGGFLLDIPDLEFPAGYRIAVVGSSGSGKSTLLRLIAGLERPQKGVIRYGEFDHLSVPITSVRQSVAVAWQHPDLLRGSLRSNIVYGVEWVDEDRLREVIEVCRLEALISSLPQGLDTPVAEWGATLSGGQQQRLSLARALIRDTPVLLLDEISSNLDRETEEALMESLVRFVSGRTVLFATHRETLVRQANQVVMMMNGRVSLVGENGHVDGQPPEQGFWPPRTRPAIGAHRG